MNRIPKMYDLNFYKVLSVVIMLIMLIMLITSIVSASLWVNDPSNCPATDNVNFQGQDCSPTNICGDDSGIAQCYDTTSISPPSSSTTSSTLYSNSFNGGYLIDCESTVDTSEPYCDNGGNAWCNRDSSCYNVNRITECTANSWETFTCGSCRSGYNYCDGSYTDADGCEIHTGYTAYPGEANANYDSNCNPQCNSGYIDCDGDLGTGNTGCEVHDGGSCTVGSLPGTYSGCTCVVAKSYFETGTETSYATSDPLLWGVQYGSGPLINMSTDSGNNFVVNNSGCIIFDDGTSQCTAGGSSSNNLNATNGLTLSSDYIKLGGSLNEDTIIDATSNFLTFDSGAYSQIIMKGNYYSNVQSSIGGGSWSVSGTNNRGYNSDLRTSSIRLIGQDDGTQGTNNYVELISQRGGPDRLVSKITIGAGIINVSSTKSGTPDINFSGIIYDKDYSSDFTNRSLVDKEYVDTKFNSISSSGSTIWNKSGNSIYPSNITDFVGIGLTNPTYPLDVYTDDGTIAKFHDQDMNVDLIIRSDYVGSDIGIIGKLNGGTEKHIISLWSNLVSLGGTTLLVNETSHKVKIGSDSSYPTDTLRVTENNDGRVFFEGDDFNFGIGSGGTDVYSADYFLVSGENSEFKSWMNNNDFYGHVNIKDSQNGVSLFVNSSDGDMAQFLSYDLGNPVELKLVSDELGNDVSFVGHSISHPDTHIIGIDGNGDINLNSFSLIINTITRNVGIGLGSDEQPGERLEVNGNINVTQTHDICIEGGNCLSDISGINQSYWTRNSAKNRLETLNSGDSIEIGTDSDMFPTTPSTVGIRIESDGKNGLIETFSGDMAEGLILHGASGDVTSSGLVHDIASSLGFEHHTLTLYNDEPNEPILFRTNNITRMQLDSAGTLKIGDVTDNIILLDVSGDTGDNNGYISRFSSEMGSIVIASDYNGNDLSLVYEDNSGIKRHLIGARDGDDEIFLGDGIISMRDNMHNVGIGASVVSQTKLRVGGNITVTSGHDICIEGGNCLSTSGSSSLFDSDSDTGIYAEKTVDEDNIRMYTNGSERLRIDKFGKIKIGDDPSYVAQSSDPLFSVGQASAENSVFSVVGRNDYTHIANFRDKDGENVFQATGSIAGNDLRVGFGDLDDAGNLPSMYADSDAITFRDDSKYVAKFSQGSITFSSNNKPIFDLNGDPTAASLIAKIGDVDEETSGTQLIIDTSQSSIKFRTEGSNLMDFNRDSINFKGTYQGHPISTNYYEDISNGYEYVGFKAPSSISNNITWVLPNSDGTSGQALLTDGSGTLSWGSVSTFSQIWNETLNEVHLISDSKNVGIGTTGSTTTKLLVESNQLNGVIARFATDGNDQGAEIYGSDDNEYFAFYGFDTASGEYRSSWFGNKDDSSKALIINGDTGNVGIGINSNNFPVIPSERLEVNGNILTNGTITARDPNDNNHQLRLDFDDFDLKSFIIDENDRVLVGTDNDNGLALIQKTIFYINNSGNVGIGTTSPSSKLFVEGNISVNSTSDICIDGGVCLGNLSNSITLQKVLDDSKAQLGYIYSESDSLEIEDDGAQFRIESKPTKDFRFGASDVMSINFNGGSKNAIIEDLRNVGNRSGLEYANDYSSDYTNRSLVDKEYVDTTKVWTNTSTDLVPNAGYPQNVKVTGNITMDGLLKLTPTDTPGVCEEGNIYFDDSLNEPCYCDGTNWQQFDGGGTC